MEKEKVILTVSFGTSYRDTREKTIGAIERQIASAFPGWDVQRAFTSGMVIRSILKKEGLHIDDVPAALEKLAAAGISELVIQPTHLMAGKEYEKMLAQIEPFRGRIGQIQVGKPLLYDEDDQKAAAAVLEELFDAEGSFDEVWQKGAGCEDSEKAVVLMGHGTDVLSDSVYTRLQNILEESGCSRIFIGTVEGSVTLQDVLTKLRSGKYRQILLAPLMVVAGDHALNDMAGDSPDSWKALLEKEGYEVFPVMRGLGEYPQIRERYVQHVKDTLCNPANRT